MTGSRVERWCFSFIIEIWSWGFSLQRATVAHLNSSESSLSSLVGVHLTPPFLARGHPDRLAERDREGQRGTVGVQSQRWGGAEQDRRSYLLCEA